MKSFALIILTVYGICFGQSELGQAIELVNASRYEEAENLVDTYLVDHSDDHRANFIKTLILIHKKLYNNASRFIEKAISSKNDKAEYYQLAGQLYENLKNTKLAIQAWEKCHAHAKDTKLFVEAKIHLNYLKKK